MRGGTLFVLTLLLVALIPGVGCGKKADPFIPKESFNPRVKALVGYWEGDAIVLKGKVDYPEEKEGSKDTILGLRIYYASYPEKSPPCPGCPIQYQGITNFGPEVIVGDAFDCTLKPGKRDQLYMIKVHLIGPGGALGPASDILSIAAE